MRKSLFLLLSSTLFFFCQLQVLQAQWASQTRLTEKMGFYHLANPSPLLFVHFDKTIYTNNETAWFTGYLFKGNPQEIVKHQVLNVALVRAVDSAIIKEEKFLILNGLSFGSMVLPDSMLTGNYHFQVSTDRVSKGIPDVIFTQPVLVKTNIDPVFNASIKLLDPAKPGKEVHQVLLNVTTRDARFLPKPAEVSYRYGNLFKKQQTNASGELILQLPEQQDARDPNVYAKIKYGRDSSFVNLALPISKRKATVHFYPEGGNLVNNLPCRIALEVKDAQMAMVTVKALLYKNKEIIDTLETNSYGIGKFMLSPEAGNSYALKLLHSGFADSTYRLPEAVTEGLTLHIAEAAAKDTLRVRLVNSRAQKLAVRIHDFRATYVYDELNVHQGIRILKIPLKEIPKGLKTITLSDSLGRPLAERMFFANYLPQQKIDVATDKTIYNQREKVTLKLRLKGADTIGLFSIACVQDNRLSARLSNDIESYAYLKKELNTLPLPPNGNGYTNKAYLEDILLVKGWSRHTWQDILQAKASDTLKTYDPLKLKIRVTKYAKPLKAPIEIGLMTGLSLGLKKTDATGEIVLENQELIVPATQKIQLIALGKHQDSYGVKVEDPYKQLNRSFLKLPAATQLMVPSTVQNNTELSLKSNEKVNRLREVKITAGNDLNLHYKRGANACGDYVCSFNILNCRNHISDSGNTHPVPGRTYTDGLGGGTIIYRDCKDEDRERFIVPIPGIYGKREFYTDSYSEPLEPAFVSTLYWNHGTLLSQKETELVFYTGDIVGKFRIMVQGLTDSDTAYEQHFFEVRGK